jgi:uncharacterized protein
MAEQTPAVTVCLALPDRQLMLPVQLPVGTYTIAQVLARIAPALSIFDAQWQHYAIAIFGKSCPPSTVVYGGEQIELLRPLVADPKLARQRRVEVRRKALGRTAWRRNSRSQKVESVSD